jgi:hypothetical protein
MIPKYPFQVASWRKIGIKLDMRLKNFETLSAATEFATSIGRAHDIKRVQISCILDDRSHSETGEVVFFDREVR